MNEVPLAELVNALFQTQRKKNGQEYSNYEVARGIKEMGLGDITASYISKLRRGDTTNPSRDVLKQLCVFFRVPASHFFPELEVFRQGEAGAEADPAMQVHTALRAAGLDPDERAQLEQLIATMSRKRRGDTP